MSENDFIRRRDAINAAIGYMKDCDVDSMIEWDIEQVLLVIPPAPEVQALVDAARKVIAAAELREAYHRLPNDKNRIGDPKSPKGKARDAWMKAFRRASSATASALSAYEKGLTK